MEKCAPNCPLVTRLEELQRKTCELVVGRISGVAIGAAVTVATRFLD